MEALNERTKRQIKRLKKMKEINDSLSKEQVKSIDEQIENLENGNN